MSSVWLCIPSARPPEEAEKVLRLYRERGYKIALCCDTQADYDAKGAEAGFTVREGGTYPGYAVAVNNLIRAAMLLDQSAEWFIAAGDDTEPDPRHSAEEIAKECREYFRYKSDVPEGLQPDQKYDYQRARQTFGVMQPTGDRWHEGVGGFTNAPIDRVCGSAWYGREYCRRMYQGTGPLFSGYKHMYVDEEAQEVAMKMGVFWQRRDLVQRHNHWGRGATDKALVVEPKLPEHLKKWNTQAHWDESKKLFLERKAAGFPGHEPL